jgi:hypothetical protein
MSCSNQWKACAQTMTSTERDASGIRSAVATAVATHLGQRVGGDHVVTGRDQQFGELAGPGAELEHPGLLGRDEPAERFLGVGRASPVVRLRDTGEGACVAARQRTVIGAHREAERTR